MGGKDLSRIFHKKYGPGKVSCGSSLPSEVDTVPAAVVWCGETDFAKVNIGIIKDGIQVNATLEGLFDIQMLQQQLRLVGFRFASHDSILACMSYVST